PPSSTGGATGGGADGTAGGASGTPGTSGSGTSPMSGSPSSGTTTPTTSSGTSSFNLGVQGDSTRVVLFVSRLPYQAKSGTNPNGDVPEGSCDLSRITYWLVQGTSGPIGLARQEVHQIMADDPIASVPARAPGCTPFIICA